MHKILQLFTFFILIISITACSQKAKKVWLDNLNISTFNEGIRPVQAKTNYRHDSIRIGGTYYQRGVGVITTSILSFYLAEKAKRFIAEVGADDSGNKNVAVKFYVIGDRKILFQSGEMKVGDLAKKVNVDLTGIKELGLLVTDSIGGVRNHRTYADWANALLIMYGNNLPAHIPNTGRKYILTPPPGKFPKINSAKIFGATPGNPVLYTVAATGERPIFFLAKNLPKELTPDSETGIISGEVNKCGSYPIMLYAKNNLGIDSQKLTLKIGNTIALTPPMGWSGWNAWEANIDEGKVLASANAMVKTGLINYGWAYINIDDSWQGKRGGKLNALQPNKKFPHFKIMIDSIHSLGLKAGLYSTPYISSYGGYPGGSSEYPNGGETYNNMKSHHQSFMHIGKYRFEKNDALQMAKWGIDFLKYDWHMDVNSAERMSSALKNSGRDIVFSLSNNAPFGKVKDWARVSNMWRTGPDIHDSWNSLYMSAFTLDKWAPYTGPGHWNDPDMMVLGNVNTGYGKLHLTRLTPDEQYTHVSIYCLLSAPLIIGCPLEQLDSFTLSLLTNNEVIAIDQDPLGKSARLLAKENGVQIWVKPMKDGSYAVGLFNTDNYGKTPQSYFRWGDEKTKSFVFNSNQVGLKGKWQIRDVWRQKNLGSFTNNIKVSIPFHGVKLLRMKLME